MRFATPVTVLFALVVACSAQAQVPDVPCAADVLHQQKMANDPVYAARHAWFEHQARQAAMGRAFLSAEERGGGGVLTVPVVVHIIHNNGPENIPDAQVIQAIDDMNQAFENIGFYDPLTGVDTEIQFCLALRDPNDDATTGINRVQNVLTDLIVEVQDIDMKNLSRWDPLSYLNIWVVKEITSSVVGSGVAGYAFFPSSHGQPEDGIVVEANYFGLNPDNSKVAVHEAGHYLGLYHTFEGACANNNCLMDGDHVCDTPPDQSTSPVNCGTVINTCTTDQNDTSPNNPFRPIGMGGLGEQDDMYINYMDYGYKSCQTAYTQGQKERMHDALNGTRASLLASDACMTPCSIPFAASFTISPPNPVPVGSTVNFTNTTGPATGFEWTLNGTVFSTNVNASYNFPDEGVYTVILTAADTVNSCLNTFSMDVVVDCPGVASFNASATTILPGGTIDFTNTSTGAISYEWILDGVSYSTNTDQSIVFNTPGIYSIYLIANTATCANTSSTVVLTVGDCDNQNYLKQWRFGYDAGLDFTSGTPVPVVGSVMHSDEGVSSIADGNGNLLFYTNGVTVWDRNNNQMPNGFGLLGGQLTSARNQAIIAPDPADPNNYYIFCNDENENQFNAGVHYSKVEMALNGGNGDVTLKNAVLCGTDQESMGGVVHDNGTDSWICIPRRFPNARLDMFHVNAQGTFPLVSTPIAPRINPGLPIFSHSGKKLAVSTASPPPVNVYIRLYDFDGTTGTFSNNPVELVLPGGQGLWCMEISPDDSKLYLVRSQQLIQFDLSLTTQAAIQASETVIAAVPFGFGEMRAATDGKIYAATAHLNDLDVINFPNLPGIACGFVSQGQPVGPGNSRLGLPLNVRGPRYSGDIELAVPAEACIGSQPLAQVISPDTACTYTWFVNDSLVQADPGDSTLLVPYLGTDSVTIRVNKACSCGAATFATTVQYIPVGTIDLGPDTAMCLPGLLTLSPGPGYADYLWHNNSITPSVNVNNAGTYWVQVHDAAGCTMSDTIVVTANNTPPLIELGPNDTLCLGAVQVLDAGPGFNSYLWQDNSTAQTFTAFQPGSYWVTVSNGCGSATDTLHIIQATDAYINLGPDTVLCTWTPILLDAGTTGISWLWQDGSVASTLLATTPGTYWVDVADERGCFAQDTITLALDTMAPVLECPEDTIGYVGFDVSSLFMPLSAPVVTEDCGFTITNSFNNTPNASGNYPIGVTIVTWTVTDANGLVSSCTHMVTVSNTVGIDGVGDAGTALRVYPNPGAGHFNVDFGDEVKSTVTMNVVNALGELVLQHTHAPGEGRIVALDLSDRANGVYHLQLATSQAVVVRKLVVQR